MTPAQGEVCNWHLADVAACPLCDPLLGGSGHREFMRTPYFSRSISAIAAAGARTLAPEIM
jgi:hypothetical protein